MRWLTSGDGPASLSDLLSGWKKALRATCHTIPWAHRPLYAQRPWQRALSINRQERQSKSFHCILYRVERKEIYLFKLVWNYSSLLFSIPCALISKTRCWSCLLTCCNWRYRGHLCLSARVHPQRQHSFILLCFDVKMNE